MNDVDRALLREIAAMSNRLAQEMSTARKDLEEISERLAALGDSTLPADRQLPA